MTSSHLNDHLSDGQFTAELLASSPDAATSRHLAECKPCREELERVRLSIASFGQVSLAWSESVQSRRLLPQTTALPLWSARILWTLAACLLLVAGLSIGRLSLQHHGLANAHTISGALSNENSEAAITRDNQLMTEVSSAISGTDQSPVAEYGLAEHTRTIHAAGAESRVE